MLTSSSSLRPAGLVLAAPRQARPLHGCRLRITRASPESSSEFEGVGGDRDLQDALVQQLRVQVESQALKEEIKEDLRERVEGIKQIGEDLIQRLDEELGIEKFRTELESTQVLSEANEKLNELEEQLQQIKDQIKADQDDLRAYENASASARSQGLFFRSLYQPQPDPEQQPGQGSDGAASLPAGSSSSSRDRVLVDAVAARQAAAVVASSAEEEVSSPFRMYLFGYMAAVLVLVLVQDLAMPEPKYALDGLYAVLGLLLGINTLNERRALMQVLQDKQRQLQQQDAAAAANSSDGTTLGGSSEQAADR